VDVQERYVSAPPEEIARAVARRLEGEVGPKLPMYVEKLIALGDAAEDAPPRHSADAALVIALAAFAVTLARNAWDVYRDVVKGRAEALTPEEIARVRGLLLRRSLERVRVPDEVPSKLRIAVVETTADATMEEAKRLDEVGSPPAPSKDKLAPPRASTRLRGHAHDSSGKRATPRGSARLLGHARDSSGKLATPRASARLRRQARDSAGKHAPPRGSVLPRGEARSSTRSEQAPRRASKFAVERACLPRSQLARRGASLLAVERACSPSSELARRRASLLAVE
jgi:hypothetical protein